jgi:hypothetical protein
MGSTTAPKRCPQQIVRCLQAAARRGRPHAPDGLPQYPPCAVPLRRVSRSTDCLGSGRGEDPPRAGSVRDGSAACVFAFGSRIPIRIRNSKFEFEFEFEFGNGACCRVMRRPRGNLARGSARTGLKIFHNLRPLRPTPAPDRRPPEATLDSHSKASIADFTPQGAPSRNRYLPSHRDGGGSVIAHRFSPTTVAPSPSREAVLSVGAPTNHRPMPPCSNASMPQCSNAPMPQGLLSVGFGPR